MNRLRNFLIPVLLLALPFAVSAQDLLTEDEAVKITMANNYEISSAGITRDIAGNNTSKFNDGTLPVVSATAGGAYNFDHAKEKIEGEVAKQNLHTFPFNAGINMSYRLYDQSRALTRNQLAGLYDLSDLQLRQTIELTLVDLLTAYWRVAQLERTVNVREDNLAISRRNLQRAQYAFEYGVTSRLSVLNNEVNVNNDSIQLQLSIVQFDNARRDLNVLMGRDASIDFTTDTTISYIGDMTLEQLTMDALERNVFLIMADQNIALDEIASELARTGWFPTIDLNGGYNWRQTPYINQPIDYLGNHGVNGGLSLSWNIFDGGRTKTAVQNARLFLEDSRLYREDIQRRIERDIQNGWAAYQTALYVVEAEQKNIETSQYNYERTQEQYNLGNVTTTTLREAQTNLLNARLGLLVALYQAKVSEIQLMQIAGRIAE